MRGKSQVPGAKGQGPRAKFQGPSGGVQGPDAKGPAPQPHFAVGAWLDHARAGALHARPNLLNPEVRDVR